jgi:archaellum component FlaC
MADEPENMTLIFLGRIDERTQRMADDLKDVKVRMTHVEEGLAGVNGRLDRVEERFERIGRQLDLVDTPR